MIADSGVRLAPKSLASPVFAGSDSGPLWSTSHLFLENRQTRVPDQAPLAHTCRKLSSPL